MKKALKIIGIVLVLLGVYYVTWTPSTDGISETAKKAVIASEERTCPNNDFRNVRHFPKEWKKDYTSMKLLRQQKPKASASRSMKA